MTSKRDLQKTIDWQKKQIEGEEASRQDAWNRLSEFGRFLDNLLELEPSLSRFRIPADDWSDGERWDFGGVKAAVEFTKSKALAQQYASPVASARSAK